MIEERKELIEKIKKQYGENYILGLLPDKVARKFIGYCSMNHDLEMVENYIAEIEKGIESETIYSSLTYSSIILYSKCFTDSSKANFPKLEANNVYRDNDNLLEFHEYLMQLRHKFLAHRNITSAEVGVAFFAFPKTLERNQLKYKHFKFA